MEETLDKTVLKFIRILRESNNHPNRYMGSMVDVFTAGSCYKLYELLKIAFPEAEAYFLDNDKNHIVTKIGEYYYDITGKRKNRFLYSEKYDLKLTQEDHKMCKHWCY